MNDENTLIPVALNCWKHHKNFISYQIKKYAAAGLSSNEELKSKLLLIGDSQTDLYTGELTPEEISDFIISKLKKHKTFDPEAYS